MAKIGLTGSQYSILPEGEYVFLIYKAEYDETFGALTVYLTTAEGKTLIERYNLKTANDEPNEKALNAFSFFAKTALDNFELTEIDHEDIVGHYIRGKVTHTTSPSKKDPSKTVTFANIGEKSPAGKFDNPPVESVKQLMRECGAEKKPDPVATAPAEDDDNDLDALLASLL